LRQYFEKLGDRRRCSSVSYLVYRWLHKGRFYICQRWFSISWLKKRPVDALLFIYCRLLFSVVVLARCRRYKILVLTYTVLAAESPKLYGTVLVSIQSILNAKMCVMYEKILLLSLHLMVKPCRFMFSPRGVIVSRTEDYRANSKSPIGLKFCSRHSINIQRINMTSILKNSAF
jgi:hypothetical protein